MAPSQSFLWVIAANIVKYLADAAIADFRTYIIEYNAAQGGRCDRANARREKPTH